MAVAAEARGEDGRRVSLADPSGGTFEAAGDFDRLIPVEDPELPLLSAIDLEGEWTVPFGRLSELAVEVSAIRDKARSGPEARGLDRLGAVRDRSGAPRVPLAAPDGHASGDVTAPYHLLRSGAASSD